MLPVQSRVGGGSTKTPLAQLLRRCLLRKQARPPVLTNPDSGLKSHLAHCTQNNPPKHFRNWAKGAPNVLEVLSDSTLPAEPLTQHHVSDPLLVNCPHHHVSRTESRQMISHRKLPLSHQYLSVTLSTSAVSKAGPPSVPTRQNNSSLSLLF